MSKIEKARQQIAKVHEIRSGSASFLLQTKTAITKQLSVIQSDRSLSAEGRRDKEQEIRDQFGIDFLQRAHRRKQAYQLAARKAYELADAVLYEQLPKPDDRKLLRFEIELRDMKVKVQLAANPERAAQVISEFVTGIDDPYFANMVREQFGDIIETVGGGDETIKAKMRRIYSDLTDRFETDEMKEARGIMESAKAAEHTALYTGIIENAALEVLGDLGQYVNRTDEFFEKFSALKTGDYAEGEDVDTPPASIEYKPVVELPRGGLPREVQESIRRVSRRPFADSARSI